MHNLYIWDAKWCDYFRQIWRFSLEFEEFFLNEIRTFVCCENVFFFLWNLFILMNLFVVKVFLKKMRAWKLRFMKYFLETTNWSFFESVCIVFFFLALLSCHISFDTVYPNVKHTFIAKSKETWIISIDLYIFQHLCAQFMGPQHIHNTQCVRHISPIQSKCMFIVQFHQSEIPSVGAFWIQHHININFVVIFHICSHTFFLRLFFASISLSLSLFVCFLFSNFTFYSYNLLFLYILIQVHIYCSDVFVTYKCVRPWDCDYFCHSLSRLLLIAGISLASSCIHIMKIYKLNLFLLFFFLLRIIFFFKRILRVSVWRYHLCF